MDVIGTTETDSGLTFGARVQLDTDYANAVEDANGEDLKGNVFVSGAFGTFSVGTGLFPMADDSGLTDIGFDGIGTDNIAEKSIYTGEADARWDYSVGALTLGASLHTIEEDYGVKAGYNFGVASVLVAYDHDESTDNDSASILLKGTVSGITGELFFADSDAYDQSWGVYAAYKTGALTLEASYADNDTVADAAYGVGAKYDLGGATLAGGVGSVNDETVADLGVTFKF